MVITEKRLTRSEAAEVLRISERTLDRWSTTGTDKGVVLDRHRMGKRVFYTLADLDVFQRTLDALDRAKRIPPEVRSRAQKRAEEFLRLCGVGR